MTVDGIAAVLLYHRVAGEKVDPFGLCVGADLFSEQLEALGSLASIRSLSEVATRLEEGRFRGRSIVITFDDGYSDNLRAALPVLKQREVVATLFVTTGAAETGGVFWWDELTSLVFDAKSNATVDLVVSGEKRQWLLGDRDEASVTGWRAWDPPPTPRAAAYRELWDAPRVLDSSRRNEMLQQIGAQLSNGDTAPPRALTIDELAEILRSGFCEIGAHTISHARLAGLVPAQQELEIVGSKLWLENNLGATVAGFSYPFGTSDTYDAETVSIVRNAGFSYACTVANAPVTSRSSLFELPRLAVEPWPAEELLAKVEALLAR